MRRLKAGAMWACRPIVPRNRAELFRRLRGKLAVAVLRMGRGWRDVGVAGKGEQHRRHAEIGERDDGRLRDADLLAVNEAEEGQTAPASAKAAALSSWRSMMKTVTAPRMMPASVAPPPNVPSPL